MVGWGVDVNTGFQKSPPLPSPLLKEREQDFIDKFILAQAMYDKIKDIPQ